MLASLRSLSKDPGVTALAVVSMVAGIGLTAALASVADAILFRPLPVADAGRIVRIYTASADQTFGLVSYPDFEDLRRASKTIAGIVAQSQILVAVANGTNTSRIRMGLAVTPDYFDVLGVSPAVGRTFRRDEVREPVVVLAYSFWEAECEADPNIAGKTIRLGGADFTVIGVARRDFGLDRFLHEDFYVPMGVYAAGLLPSSGKPFEDRARRYLNLYGRLASGASIYQARAEVATVAASLATEYPETNRGRRALVLTEFEARVGVNRTMPALAGLLLGLAVLILSIVCANVAGLMLVRAEGRSVEIAVRVALGASRARLLGDGLMESALLGVAGAALGVPLAWAAIQMVTRAAVLPTDIRLAIAPELDARVALTIMAALMVLIIVCGIAPILGMSHRDLTGLLKSGPSERGNLGLRRALVTIEIVLATVLVSCGGLLWNGIRKAGRLDLGYRTDQVLVMALDPAQVRYGEGQSRVFYDQVLERVRRLAGVQRAELAQSVPLGYSSAQRLIAIEGEQERRAVWMNIVTPGYFGLMHLKVTAGRAFDDHDTALSGPVAIVNEELAKQCGVGGRISMNGRVLNVVGVVATAAYFQVGETPRAYFYLPFSQNYASRMVLHVESKGDAARAVLDTIRNVDSDQPVSEVRALSDYLSGGAMSNARIAITVLGIAAACGILLALTGVYGVVAHAMARRRREIGLRMALGARRPLVMVIVLRDGLKIVMVGTAGGLGTTLTVARFLGGVIAGADRHDWRVLGVAGSIVMLAGLAACVIPAWKASGMDPARALRE